VAKIVNVGDNIVIVLSPSIFTENNDNQTRMFIYAHEIAHVTNRMKFPSISNNSFTENQYLYNLYSLYDEYVADRLAYNVIEKIFPVKSDYWKALIKSEAQLFPLFISDFRHYDAIKSEIKAFRVHADVELYMKNIKRIFDDVSLATTHSFSLSDSDPSRIRLIDLINLPFVNEKTIALMTFFKGKYEENIFNIHDGIDLIIDFMTNLGMRFDDRPNSYYCYVLDI